MAAPNPPAQASTACASCGSVPVDGYTSCENMWDDLLAKSFSEFAFARFHRPIVDAYSLQHPAQYCKSAKSYAAHLTGLCCHIEHQGSSEVNRSVQRWLSGNVELDKPPVPHHRGDLTLAHVLGAAAPAEIAECLEEWFRSVWAAFSDLHGTTREWIERVMV